MRSNISGKFVGYRTVAMATDHTDAIGYLEITSWPTLDDCLIAAWDIASKSTWRGNMAYSAPLPVKWVIAQCLITPNFGRGIPYWRTIEVIALNHDGSRIIHSVSDRSGIAFDCDTPDADFGPQMRYERDQWGYDILPLADSYPIDTHLTPSDIGVPSHAVIRANNADDTDISVVFSGDYRSCHAYLLEQMAFVRSLGYDANVVADDTVDCSHAELGSWRLYIDEMLPADFDTDDVVTPPMNWGKLIASEPALAEIFGNTLSEPREDGQSTSEESLYDYRSRVEWELGIVRNVSLFDSDYDPRRIIARYEWRAAYFDSNGMDEETLLETYATLEEARATIDDIRTSHWEYIVGNDGLSKTHYDADVDFGVIHFIVDTLSADVAIEADLSTNMVCSDLGGLEQIAYCNAGVSHEIRSALVSKLGWPIDVADQAVITWRAMDNGQYGWIADLPNGASYYWSDGDFRRPTPRAELSDSQVAELLIQLEHFSNVSYESDDLDRCIAASAFALAIMGILG